MNILCNEKYAEFTFEASSTSNRSLSGIQSAWEHVLLEQHTLSKDVILSGGLDVSLAARSLSYKLYTEKFVRQPNENI